MEIALKLFGLLLVLTGVAGLVLPALPGTPLIFLGVLAVAWADGFQRIGMGTLGVLLALTVVATVVDYAAGVMGARRLGASRWGVLGAVVGLVAGLAFGILGIVFGPAVGAVAFEYWRDPDFKKAAKAGAGAVIGFALGMVAKVAIGMTMLGIAAVAYFT